MTLFLPFTEQNIILTGYVGPEQPHLARKIAERLRMPVVNVELEIANRVNLPVEEILNYYGETHLKAVEADIVQEVALRRGTVINISGRVLLNGDHLARLQSTGMIVCLVIELGAMLRRLHMTMGAHYHDPQERAVALAELKREWAIRHIDGIHKIDTTYQTQEETITEVAELWQKLAVRRG
jgi:shikimate kinase